MVDEVTVGIAIKVIGQLALRLSLSMNAMHPSRPVRELLDDMQAKLDVVRSYVDDEDRRYRAATGLDP